MNMITFPWFGTVQGYTLIELPQPTQLEDRPGNWVTIARFKDLLGNSSEVLSIAYLMSHPSLSARFLNRYTRISTLKLFYGALINFKSELDAHHFMYGAAQYHKDLLIMGLKEDQYMLRLKKTKLGGREVKVARFGELLPIVSELSPLGDYWVVSADHANPLAGEEEFVPVAGTTEECCRILHDFPWSGGVKNGLAYKAGSMEEAYQIANLLHDQKISDEFQM